MELKEVDGSKTRSECPFDGSRTYGCVVLHRGRVTIECGSQGTRLGDRGIGELCLILCLGKVVPASAFVNPGGDQVNRAGGLSRINFSGSSGDGGRHFESILAEG